MAFVNCKSSPITSFGFYRQQIFSPVLNDILITMLKPILMVMLFLIFLKTGITEITTNMKNYMQMIFIIKQKYLLPPVNILMRSLMVYIAMGSQREVILSDFKSTLWDTFVLYAVFILLHVIGHFMGIKENRKNSTYVCLYQLLSVLPF